MSTEDDVRDALRSADASVRPEFVADLRRRLTHDFDNVAELTDEPTPHRSRRVLVGAFAAALVGAVAIAGAVRLRSDDSTASVAARIPAGDRVVTVTVDSVLDKSNESRVVTDPAVVAKLADDIARAQKHKSGGFCTAELGPIYTLAFATTASAPADVTVKVENYGCRVATLNAGSRTAKLEGDELARDVAAILANNDTVEPATRIPPTVRAVTVSVALFRGEPKTKVVTGADQVARFARDVEVATPRKAGQICTADLGPVFTFEFATAKGAPTDVKVVVGNYGCRDAELTSGGTKSRLNAPELARDAVVLFGLQP